MWPIQSRQHTRASRTATGRIVELSESNTSLSQLIQVRSFDFAPIALEIRVAHVVGKNVNDVWLRSGFFAQRRKRCGGANHSQRGGHDMEKKGFVPVEHQRLTLYKLHKVFIGGAPPVYRIKSFAIKLATSASKIHRRSQPLRLCPDQRSSAANLS
jgi:hypothetical protein